MRSRGSLFLLFAILLLPVLLSAQFSPITVTGFNNDAVAEGPPNSLSTTTLQLDGASSNKVMYTNAFRTFAGIFAGGLPDNGTIISGSDTYQMAPYNGNNALYVKRNETFSLAVTTPASYARLRILCFTTEGASSLNISLGFSDGSTSNYLTNYSLPDWFNGTTNVVLQGFGRCDRSVGPVYNADAFPTNPRMYYIELVLTCADLQKQVSSINFANVSTFPNNAPFPNAVFFAVSGMPYSQVITPAITPSDCSGPNGSITLNVIGSSFPYTFTWNTNPVQGGSSAILLAPGSYTATITDANGCITTYNATVPLNNNAAMTASASPTAICPTGNTQLTANVTTGNLTNFTWTPGNLTGGSVNVSPTSTTTYSVTGTNSLGCTATAQVTVTVNATPAAPVVNPITICAGATATLQVQNPQPGFTYNWYDAATGGILLATGTSYTTPSMASTFTFHVESISNNNCISTTRTPVTVTVTNPPAAPSVAGVSICSGDDAILNVTNPQAGITYSWFATATGGSSIATGASFTVNNVTAPTTYYVESSTSGGCISSSRTAVSISLLSQLPAPVVSLTNTTFSSLTFSWNAVPGAIGYEVTTNGGASFQAPSSGSTGTTHTISGLAGNTTIIIQVRAIGQQSCETSTLSAPVPGTTLSSKEIFVPNVFTPNGDGRNDVLLVFGNYIGSIQFRIFNQWGEMIFYSESMSQGWNGTHKGKQQPIGVYAYTLKVTLQDGTVVNKKGSISLIR